MRLLKAERTQWSMNRLEELLSARLKSRANEGNLRQLPARTVGADFFSNDYLGWATSGAINNILNNTSSITGATGSTGSRLLSGNSPEAEALEREIAHFHKGEAALIYNSGYDANSGLLSAIGLRGSAILYDELCHASIIDGIRLSFSNKYKFQHNDLGDLSEKLTKFSGNGPVIVIVESVYSMDGDLAPLTEIAGLCLENNAQLIVDEAHATGVFGDCGEGIVVALGLQDQVFARVHTFGKALGCHGAAAVGSTLLVQYLNNFSRQFIYTTALPPHSLQAIAGAYQLLSAPGFSNRGLHGLISYFRNNAIKQKIPGYKESLSPIQVVVTGSNMSAISLAEKIRLAGFQVKAILSPTVPPGGERIRLCLHSFNTEEQIDILLNVLGTNV